LARRISATGIIILNEGLFVKGFFFIFSKNFIRKNPRFSPTKRY